MEQLNRIDKAGEGISKLEDRFKELHIIQHRKKNGKYEKEVWRME